jgi:hypothetical protein
MTNTNKIIEKLRKLVELAENGKLDLGRRDSDYCYGFIDGLQEAIAQVEEVDG